eukprot:1722686-Rhodomonas_salina.1
MSALPTSEKVLAGHEKHNDPAVAFRYVPAEHAVHDPDPFTALYEPTEQLRHNAPSRPSYPMLQMQPRLSPVFAAESVWFGQLRQVVAALALE